MLFPNKAFALFMNVNKCECECEVQTIIYSFYFELIYTPLKKVSGYMPKKIGSVAIIFLLLLCRCYINIGT